MAREDGDDRDLPAEHYYLAAEREGEVGAGDAVELLERHPDAVPVSEVTRLFVHDRDDLDGLRRLASLEALPEDWRRLFRERTRAVG